MKELVWKHKWETKRAYPVITLTKPITNKNGYYQVTSIDQMSGVYFWMHPSTKVLTHQFFFEKNREALYMQDIIKQIKKGCIWKKVVVEPKKKKNEPDKNQQSLW